MIQLLFASLGKIPIKKFKIGNNKYHQRTLSYFQVGVPVREADCIKILNKLKVKGKFCLDKQIGSSNNFLKKIICSHLKYSNWNSG